MHIAEELLRLIRGSCFSVGMNHCEKQSGNIRVFKKYSIEDWEEVTRVLIFRNGSISLTCIERVFVRLDVRISSLMQFLHPFEDLFSSNRGDGIWNIRLMQTVGQTKIRNQVRKQENNPRRSQDNPKTHHESEPTRLWLHWRYQSLVANSLVSFFGTNCAYGLGSPLLSQLLFVLHLTSRRHRKPWYTSWWSG